jgi:septum formation protein
VPEVDEARRPGEAPADYVARLALAKAGAVAATPDTDVVVAADTVVTLGARMLGKPVDQGEASQMLADLSGTWHAVLTGFVVGRVGRAAAPEVVETAVRFKRLSDHERDCYLATGEWRDKAGGYGAQGRAAFVVEALRGSYTNIVGLPLAEVVDRLAVLGVVPSAAAMVAAPEARA